MSLISLPALEGLEGVDIQQFVGITDLRKAVKLHSDKLQAGASDQYLVFKDVTTKDLTEIDRGRHSIGRHTRMTYYANSNMLIIKLMQSAAHVAAQLILAL
jgi:hypothetical protein